MVVPFLHSTSAELRRACGICSITVQLTDTDCRASKGIRSRLTTVSRTIKSLTIRQEVLLVSGCQLDNISIVDSFCDQ
jgi:hypothetical protein